jgi:type II secretory pathway component PulF
MNLKSIIDTIRRCDFKKERLKDESMMWCMFGTMLSSGVPILQSLNILAKSFPDYQTFVQNMHDSVKEGNSIDEVVSRYQGNVKPQIHPFVGPYLRLGEETGAFPETCDRLGKMIYQEYELSDRRYKSDARNKALFYVRLSDMLNFGMPLLRALREIEKVTDYPPKDVVHNISESIESGSTFSEAISQHPKYFMVFERGMVLAGECAGVLDIVLERTSNYFIEKAKRT